MKFYRFSWWGCFSYCSCWTFLVERDHQLLTCRWLLQVNNKLRCAFSVVFDSWSWLKLRRGIVYYLIRAFKTWHTLWIAETMNSFLVVVHHAFNLLACTRTVNITYGQHGIRESNCFDKKGMADPVSKINSPQAMKARLCGWSWLMVNSCHLEVTIDRDRLGWR